MVECLRQAGAEIQEIGLPSSFSGIHANGRTIMAVEASTYHQEMFADRKNEYGTEIGKLIEDGLTIPTAEYVKALQRRLQQYADIKTVRVCCH